MTRTSKFTTWSLFAALAAATAAPVLADQQSDKNNMRNLAIAGAAIAGYGLLNHNNTATLLGAAGAAVAGSQYEKDRKQQSQDSNDRYYYRRPYTSGSSSYGYNNGYSNNTNNGYWNRSGSTYNNGSSANNGYWNRSGSTGYSLNQNAYGRQDNGNHKGWFKNHKGDRD